MSQKYKASTARYTLIIDKVIFLETINRNYRHQHFHLIVDDLELYLSHFPDDPRAKMMLIVANFWLRKGSPFVNATNAIKQNPNNADLYYTRWYLLVNDVRNLNGDLRNTYSKYKANPTEENKNNTLAKLNAFLKIAEQQIADSDKALELNPSKFGSDVPMFNVVKDYLKKAQQIKARLEPS